MLTKIDDIHLYTCDAITPNTECAAAVQYFADNSVIDYTLLNYADPTQHADCLAPINTWWHNGEPEVTGFPFVIYTEIHDNLPPSRYPLVAIQGLDNITNSTFAEIYQLGREDQFL